MGEKANEEAPAADIPVPDNTPVETPVVTDPTSESPTETTVDIENPPEVETTKDNGTANINRDSYQATKEEIEDSLEFIKSKLNAPEVPTKTKRQSKEIKHLDEAEIPPPPPSDVVIPLPVVVPNKSSDVLETKKESEVAVLQADKETEPVVEKFATECIPPVRPERLKRHSAKLNVPDWQPPKQNIFDYIFGCFKSKP